MKKSELGKLLAYKRLQNGYSQSALARELKIDQAAISRWENGTCKPSPAIAKKISKLLKIDLAKIYYEGVE